MIIVNYTFLRLACPYFYELYPTRDMVVELCCTAFMILSGSQGDLTKFHD